jgi:hypothetical protein
MKKASIHDDKSNSVRGKNIGAIYVTLGSLVTIVVVGGGGYLAVKNGWLTISQGRGDNNIAVQGNGNTTQHGNGSITSVNQPSISAPVNDITQGDEKNSASDSSIANINAAGSVNIYYDNSKLPGYFPETSFKAPPSDLSKYRTANLLSQEMIGLGQALFGKGVIFILGQQRQTIFRLSGSIDEQRVGFKLSGIQKAVLLQFGLQDLSSGTTTLTYRVKVSADGKLLWGGECRYGQQQQIVSVPLDIPEATSLVIEYSVVEDGGFASYNIPPLHFTKAELLSE